MRKGAILPLFFLIYKEMVEKKLTFFRSILDLCLKKWYNKGAL